MVWLIFGELNGNSVLPLNTFTNETEIQRTLKQLKREQKETHKNKTSITIAQL
jgi:hypothetical protein